ncbi:hypothetical protein LWC35_20770 [Pseudonocardia kujensis]|uniref:hypothetical protein n=1 Tax=Pseudonocardia kujensis TaxID=1128675 RepID=UPI001E2F98C2|nr:hypothetical protein [Pseudonocardia kujensis]MCE0765316.1 hypothetical protein [Pseudonocardia kujensis]
MISELCEPGTATTRTGRHRVPETPLERASRVVVAAVDGAELLAEAGGLLQHLLAGGAEVEILVAVDADTRPLARCGLRSVPVHRLGLRRPLPAAAAADLLAALSEVVGFDPGPGLGILAAGELAGRPDRAAVAHAAEVAAAVYGAEIARSLPDRPVAAPATDYLLTGPEAAHKRYAVGPGATLVESFLADLRVTGPRA